jgi:hypothetical protein
MGSSQARKAVVDMGRDCEVKGYFFGTQSVGVGINYFVLVR